MYFFIVLNASEHILENILISFSTVSNNNLISSLLYDDNNFNDTKNRIRLSSQAFNEQLFWQYNRVLNYTCFPATWV